MAADSLEGRRNTICASNSHKFAPENNRVPPRRRLAYDSATTMYPNNALDVLPVYGVVHENAVRLHLRPENNVNCSYTAPHWHVHGHGNVSCHQTRAQCALAIIRTMCTVRSCVGSCGRERLGDPASGWACQFKLPLAGHVLFDGTFVIRRTRAWQRRSPTSRRSTVPTSLQSVRRP